MSNARSKFDMIAEYLQRTQEGVTTAPVFRKPGILREGEAFCVFFQDGLAVRVHGSALKQAMALPGARPFDPLNAEKPPPGVPGWVWLPPSQMLRWDRLAIEALRCLRDAKEKVRVSWTLPPPPPEPPPLPPPSTSESLAQRVKSFFSAGLSKFGIG